MTRFLLLNILLALAIYFGVARASIITDRCRCMPGDKCWPSQSTWKAFNYTVGGNLIATVPIGSPCHEPTYDEAKCAALQKGWTSPMTHCDPFTDSSTSCQLGNYVSFAVNVQSSKQVASTVKFAREHNIRLVIKNSGHDYFGRCTGAGALSIWIQGLKDISFSRWSDSYYSGRTMTVGGGVLGYEAIEAANANDAVVYTAESGTVGLAGAFTQGGGHGALATAFGLAADQTLSFEVVTASGSIVTASRTKNSDLYWALSGGGGGNYGIVTSMTVRVQPNYKVGGGSFTLLPSSVSSELYFAASTRLLAHLPRLIEKGASLTYAVRPQYFAVRSIMVWNSTGEYVKEIMTPYVEEMRKLGLNLTLSYATRSYRDHFDQSLGPIPEGLLPVGDAQGGGHLLPKSVLEKQPEKYGKTIADIVSSGAGLLFSVANYSKRYKGLENSVIPEWRNAIAQVNLLATYNPAGPWENVQEAQSRISNEYMPKLKAASPSSYAYMNEANIQEKDWKKLFYSTNYLPLWIIKKKWDLEHGLYAFTGVGSDEWELKDDGRLCKC